MADSDREGAGDAVGQVTAFLVAGAIFMAALAALLITSRDEGTGGMEPADAAVGSLVAANLLQVLVGSPGIGLATPDQITRLGLATSNGTGLQPASLDLLRGANYSATAGNGRIDYLDAKNSLGMDATTQFHLRMYPVGLDAVYQESLTGTRVAYVGDWLSLPGASLALDTPPNMLTSAQARLNLTIGPNVIAERNAIVGLGVAFNDAVHLTVTNPPLLADLPVLPDPPLLTHLGLSVVAGDVYPDQKQYIDAILHTRLNQYKVLVVGSGVDQNSLTSEVTKNAIRDWVLAGGTLVVFGSNSQNFQWLQPLFQVGTANVNGGAFAPDISHPLLHEPHPLNWQSYNSYNLSWDIKSTGSGARYNDFTHVVVSGGKDLLAVSNQGAFGPGRIFLTSYRAGDVAQSLGVAEAGNFLANIFLYTEHGRLYLEYGPEIPAGVAVSTAVRQSLLHDVQFGVVPVRLELHVWQGS